MRWTEAHGATSAPNPDALRRSRVLARVGLSPALADAVAGLAFGADRRDHGALLASVTASRTASAGAVRL